MRDPFVIAVVNGHRHWKEHQLEMRYGGHIPEALIRGIEVYDAALNRVNVDEIRQQAERDAPPPQDDDLPRPRPRGSGRGPRGHRRR